MAEDWFVGTIKSENGTWLVRGLSALPADSRISENPTLIIARWAYEGGDMPDQDTHQAILEFEDAVFASIEQDPWAVEAASLTGEGSKEWRFYTGDVGNFMFRFNEALAGHPAYPLEFQSFEDPDWSALSELQPA